MGFGFEGRSFEATDDDALLERVGLGFGLELAELFARCFVTVEDDDEDGDAYPLEFDERRGVVGWLE